MGNVTGVVEAYSKTKYGYGILVDGNWYNSKYEIKAEKGDEVSFEDGGKTYCQKLKVINGGGGSTSASKPAGKTHFSKGVFPIPANDGQRAILRQNALTNSVNLFCHNTEGTLEDIDSETIQKIVEVARAFEAFTAGDIDKEAAKQMGFDPNE